MLLWYSCALVANAASFVLPISNPANLVLYGAHMPALGVWLAHFAAPSVASIVCTFVILRIVQRRALSGHSESAPPAQPTPRGRPLAPARLATTSVPPIAASVPDPPPRSRAPPAGTLAGA